MFVDDNSDQALFLHAIKAVLDLILVRDQQRATPLERDADLHAREPSWPPVNNPADRTRDTAELKHEDMDGREAAGIRHDVVSLIALSSRLATRSWPVRL